MLASSTPSTKEDATASAESPTEVTVYTTPSNVTASPASGAEYSLQSPFPEKALPPRSSAVASRGVPAAS